MPDNRQNFKGLCDALLARYMPDVRPGEQTDVCVMTDAPLAFDYKGKTNTFGMGMMAGDGREVEMEVDNVTIKSPADTGECYSVESGGNTWIKVCPPMQQRYGVTNQQ